jgi:hypothetical protein
MSKGNVEIVQRGYDAAARRDAATVSVDGSNPAAGLPIGDY